MEARPAAAPAPASPAAPPTPLDARRLEALQHDLGDPAVVRQLVLDFLAQLGGRVAAIELAAGQGDGPAASRAAHTLKSTAALVGATDLAEACSAVEHRHGTTAAVRAASAPAARELRRWVGAQVRSW